MNNSACAIKSGIRTEQQKVSCLEKICLILLALCPILQHYRGIVVNAAITVLIFVFPYICTRLISKKKVSLKQISCVLPLVCFFIYRVVARGATIMEVGQAVILSVLVIAISSGCVSSSYFLKVVTAISAFASLCIIAQYASYYVTGNHIQMVPVSLLLEKSEPWVLGAQTGRAGITGVISKFYRPSAFFLEPSHMFIYMFMPLAILMYSPNQSKAQKRKSLLITAGMVLSTSGMGIVTAICLWLLYFGKEKGGERKFRARNFLRPSIMIFFVAFVAGLLIAYYKVPFFQNSVNRIVGSGSDYSNAISGRVRLGNELIQTLSGEALLFGASDTLEGIEFNMSGFNATMYRYGIVGTIVSYIFYLQGLIKAKNSYFWISVITIILSLFSAHTHSMFFMIYSALVMVDGYKRFHAFGY